MNKLVPGIALSVPILHVFAFLTVVPDRIWSPKFYGLFFLSFLSLVALTVCFYRRQEPMKFGLGYPEGVLLTLLTYLIIRDSFQPTLLLDNHALLALLLMVPLYFFYRMVFADHQYLASQRIIIGTFLGAGLLQAIVALLQYLHLLPNLISYFELGGTLGNPNVLATYLTSSTLLAGGILLFRKEPLFQHPALVGLSVATGLLSAIVVVLVQSRSAWLGSLVGAMVILAYLLPLRWRVRLRSWPARAGVLVMAMVVGGALLYGLYRMRPESADGRRLIWKITSNLITDHPVVGVGTGRFEAAYGRYQVAYFSNSYPEAEAQLASGDVRVAYNTYLHWWAEHGIIGLVLWLAFIIISIRHLLRADASPSGLSYVALGGWLALLVNGMFSFTIYVVPVLFNFFFLLALINRPRTVSPRASLPQYMTSLLTVLGLFFFFAVGIKKMQSLRAELRIAPVEQALRQKQYAKAYRLGKELHPHLRYHREFAMIYGKTLYLSRLHKQAIQHLEASLEQFSDPKIHQMLGDSYWRDQQLPQAEEAYLDAVHLAPHQYRPRYALVKLYERRGKIDEVVNLSQATLAMPTKIPSAEVKHTKAQLAELLETYTRLQEYRDEQLRLRDAVQSSTEGTP